MSETDASEDKFKSSYKIDHEAEDFDSTKRDVASYRDGEEDRYFASQDLLVYCVKPKNVQCLMNGPAMAEVYPGMLPDSGRAIKVLDTVSGCIAVFLDTRPLDAPFCAAYCTELVVRRQPTHLELRHFERADDAQRKKAAHWLQMARERAKQKIEKALHMRAPAVIRFGGQKETKAQRAARREAIIAKIVSERTGGTADRADAGGDMAQSVKQAVQEVVAPLLKRGTSDRAAKKKSATARRNGRLGGRLPADDEEDRQKALADLGRRLRNGGTMSAACKAVIKQYGLSIQPRALEKAYNKAKRARRRVTN